MSQQFAGYIRQFKKGVNVLMRYNTFINLSILLGVLLYGLFSVQQILSLPDDAEYRQAQIQKNTKTFFDQDTIQKVRGLRQPGDIVDPELPPGRINPFAE